MASLRINNPPLKNLSFLDLHKPLYIRRDPGDTEINYPRHSPKTSSQNSSSSSRLVIASATMTDRVEHVRDMLSRLGLGIRTWSY